MSKTERLRQTASQFTETKAGRYTMRAVGAGLTLLAVNFALIGVDETEKDNSAGSIVAMGLGGLTGVSGYELIARSRRRPTSGVPEVIQDNTKELVSGVDQIIP